MRARAGTRRHRLPVTLQSEIAECGLACLAMVAAYWGHGADLAGLRERLALSLKGCTLRALIDMAGRLGLHARPVKIDLAQLDALALPCVLHWDMDHFVVLAEAGPRHLVVHDPAAGRRRLSRAEVSAHFTGVALELRPGPDFVATNAAQVPRMRDWLGPVPGLRAGLAQGLVLALTLQVCMLGAPVGLQWVVDEALARSDRSMVGVLGVGFVLLAATRAVFAALRSWSMAALAANLNYGWLGKAFAHLMKLPLAYFEKRHLGDIVSRFSSIQAIQHSLTTQFVEALVDGLLAIATLAMMVAYSAPLAAWACGALACYGGLRALMFRPLREASAEQIVLAARQQTHLMESVRGVVSLRLFDRGELRRIGLMNRLADQFNAEWRVARLAVGVQTAQLLLTGTARALAVWLGALAVLDGRMTTGMMFAFLACQEHFGASVSALIDKAFELRMLGLHAERVADILATPAEPDEPGAAGDPDAALPSLELRDIGFRYADGEPFVLRHLDLCIRAGECVALTGASGCGKTTLVKLLLGLLVPTEGQILVGGVPVQAIGWAAYRRRVAAVMQDDPLFAGSIADNIAFFDPAPDPDRIASCARQAAIADEIDTMPMRYRTQVGETGSGLSGGQKQRILLARALYKAPQLLVLDEATSHLDLANEQRVNTAIQACQLTRLLVAHRPQTIAMAQRVVVLAQGRVVRDLAPLDAPDDAAIRARATAAVAATAPRPQAL